MTSTESPTRPASPTEDRWHPPPRDTLPPGLTIEELPIVGTTWYERGVRYWLRRTGFVLGLLLALVVMTLILGGLFSLIRHASTTAFYVAVGIEATYTLAILAYLTARYLKARKNPQEIRPADPQKMAEARRVARVGPALGILAGSGSIAGQFFLVIGSLLTYGLILAMLAMSCLSVLPFERLARREFRCQLDLFSRAMHKGHDIEVPRLPEPGRRAQH